MHQGDMKGDALAGMVDMLAAESFQSGDVLLGKQAKDTALGSADGNHILLKVDRRRKGDTY